MAKFFSSLLITCAVLIGLFFLTSADKQPGKKRILVGSPIRQNPAILAEFLQSLKEQNQSTYTLDYYFIDDNVNEESKKLLADFCPDPKVCTIEQAISECKENYVCDDKKHHWKEAIIWKVAGFKDKMIAKAKEENYDYLFLIDSDLVMHPKTIEQLIIADKDILSNIFWTAWDPGTIPMPQVWLTDEYTVVKKGPKENLTPEETRKRMNEFFSELRVPGVYKVGGLGACTLLSKNAINKGINFQKIYNVSFWGEDRHFCIRAVALGLDLFVDTHYPAFHIYRDSELANVEKYKNENLTLDLDKKPRLTLSLIMKNEADHFLKEMLTSAREYITDAVIIDDASTDNSVAICEEVLKNIPYTIVKNSESKFSNEVNLRKQQWEETLKTNPDWILVLDADEIFEDKFKTEIHNIIADRSVDAVYFRLYDFWDENHYRDDQYWSAHKFFRPFLIRNKPGAEYKWKETSQHCGRLPLNVFGYKYKTSQLRLKHYGWVRPDIRKEKYDRYMNLDPGARYGWKEQYESILDPEPNLVTWTE